MRVDASAVIDDGDKVRLDGALFTGEVLDRGKDGAPTGLTSYQRGVRHGPILGWYPDGRLRSCEMAVLGRAVGPQRWWYPNGSPAGQDDFDSWGRLERRRRWDVLGMLVEDEWYTARPTPAHRLCHEQVVEHGPV